MHILVIEDDHLQVESLSETLKQFFPGSRVDHINTEFEFRSRIDDIAKARPDLIVLDMMLRWTDPAEDMPARPDEVVKGKYFRAGLRCDNILSKHEGTKHIPVILYTVLEDADLKEDLDKLRPQTSYVRKDADAEPLISLIREMFWREQ
jgi:CheY-like chemotaxis protein